MNQNNRIDVKEVKKNICELKELARILIKEVSILEETVKDATKNIGDYNVDSYLNEYLVEFVEALEIEESMMAKNANYTAGWYFKTAVSKENCFRLSDRFEKSFKKNLNKAIICNVGIYSGLKYKTVRNGSSVKVDVLTDSQLTEIKKYVEMLKK